VAMVMALRKRVDLAIMGVCKWYKERQGSGYRRESAWEEDCSRLVLMNYSGERVFHVCSPCLIWNVKVANPGRRINASKYARDVEVDFLEWRVLDCIMRCMCNELTLNMNV
jgi:hypothetical protein